MQDARRGTNTCSHSAPPCGDCEQMLTSGGFPLPLSRDCVGRNEDEPPAELDALVHLACLHGRAIGQCVSHCLATSAVMRQEFCR